MDGTGEWVRQVNLTNLGTAPVPASSKIALSLVLTNAWTNTPFGSNSLTVSLCSKDNAYLSRGTLTLASLTQTASFTPAAI